MHTLTRLLMALAATILTGCAAMGSYSAPGSAEEQFVAEDTKFIQNNIALEVLYVDNVGEAYVQMVTAGIRAPGAVVPRAFALWNVRMRACTIVLAKEDVGRNDILGHEVRHCFQGAYHL